MPVIPEKRELDARVQRALAAQFWAQPVQSARALAGLTTTVPCEPPALPLVAPSGLSRTQLLVAAQAAGLPLFPGWCEEHGGAVLDRVLLQSGRPRWWAALTGRLKAQRMIGQRDTHTLREVLSDPDNYAIAASGRLLLSHATTLRASLQADSLSQLPNSVAGWRLRKGRRGGGGARGKAAAEDQAAGGSARGSGSGGASKRGASAALQLKQQLLDGYELTADLAVNEPSLDGVRSSVNTPLRLCVDVAPRPTQGLAPVLYRVGLHGVLAPEAAEGGRGAHVLAAHMQGALALAGARTLWQSSTKPWQRPAKHGLERRPISALAQPQQLSNAATDRQQQHQQQPVAAEAVGAPTRQPGLDATPDDGTRAGSKQRRHASKPRRARAGAPAREVSAPQLVTPGQVQDGLQQTTWRLERLRTDLQSWASRARAGELLSSGKPRARNFVEAPGGCWSAVLPAPHFRVCGMLGVLGRVPLHHSTFDAPGSLARGAAAAASPARRARAGRRDGAGGSGGAGEGEDDGAPAGARAAAFGSGAWLRQVGSAGRGFMEHVVLGGLGGLGGLGSHLARDVGVRLFASGGASLQVGRMRRNFLDFTRLEATLDAGLTGPKVVGGGGADADGEQRRGRGAGGVRHPAFALDESGAWHALTLSASQQLVGPIRARADWRFALDSAVAPPRGALGAAAPAAAAQLARHVGGMRPSLLDAAYGLDMVIPGSGGLVRGVVWFSPRRGEGAVELRLL